MSKYPNWRDNKQFTTSQRLSCINLYLRSLGLNFTKTFYENEETDSLTNNIDGVFSALKRTVLIEIFSKKCSSKKREMAFKII